MEIRKLNYNGSSFTIALPPTFMRELAWRSGMQISVSVDEKQRLVLAPLHKIIKEKDNAPR